MQTPRINGPGSERDRARFYAKVALPDEQGCMLWQGQLRHGGYGGFWLKGHTVPAHRFAYELWVGIPAVGLVLDHLCRVRRCVAPEHLEAVTQAENIRRGETGQLMAAKTHCPQGHEYAGVNLYIRPDGTRTCRECKNAQWRAMYYRRKGCKPSPAA